MKKAITIVLLLACFYSQAQSIQLFYEKQYVPNEDTLTIIVPSTTSNHYLDIVNTSSNTIKLMVKRTRIFLLQDAENMFCLGRCYSPETDEMPTEEAIDFFSRDTLSPYIENSDFFETTYRPYGQKGISIIKYTFYDKNNPSDETSVIFKFDSESVGIKDNISNINQLSVYPNPTTGQLIIDNREKTIENIEIFDVLGKLLQSKIVNLQSKIEIDISHLANGIYYLKIDGKTVKIVKK